MKGHFAKVRENKIKENHAFFKKVGHWTFEQTLQKQLLVTQLLSFEKLKRGEKSDWISATKMVLFNNNAGNVKIILNSRLLSKLDPLDGGFEYAVIPKCKIYNP